VGFYWRAGFGWLGRRRGCCCLLITCVSDLTLEYGLGPLPCHGRNRGVVAQASAILIGDWSDAATIAAGQPVRRSPSKPQQCWPVRVADKVSRAAWRP
jgi:hypothetical protein